MITQKMLDTVEKLQNASRNMPKVWDGKSAILEMRDAGSKHWRQTEWIGFYFEFLCEIHFDCIIDMPGKKYGNTEFDAFYEISWDFKAHAINAKSAKYEVIANDMEAMNNTLSDYGHYGMILANGEAKYNDEEGTFKKWHDQLKGEMTQYQKERIRRGAKSKLRKTEFVLSEIRFICFDMEMLNQCSKSFQKGFRNADGSPRKEKVKVDIRKIPSAALITTQNF